MENKITNEVNNIATLGIVVPCFNEEEILEYTNNQLTNLLDGLINTSIITDKSFIGYVDDGSSDKTWTILENFTSENDKIKIIKLSRNFGHQGALLAGLENFSGFADCVVSIDADLQDDIGVIKEMIEAYNDGFDIVYGVRKERERDTFFKRFTATFFYKLMIKLGVNIVYNHADFRLTSRRVINTLKDYSEVNLFLRGLFPLIGFQSKNVYYDRLERLKGETKYTLKKMLAFAFDGISSFSVQPLRIVTYIGFLVFILSVILAGYSVYSFFFLGTVPGWTSITLPIYFISGIQLLSIGIIGEYMGKIYKEVKARPRYVIEYKNF